MLRHSNGQNQVSQNAVSLFFLISHVVRKELREISHWQKKEKKVDYVLNQNKFNIQSKNIRSLAAKCDL